MITSTYDAKSKEVTIKITGVQAGAGKPSASGRTVTLASTGGYDWNDASLNSVTPKDGPAIGLNLTLSQRAG